MCFPSPARLKDENDITRALAALVYFKLCQQTIGGTKQFEVAAHYNMNQKRLSEVIHSKKYLGGKQKKQKGAGTKGDPEIIDEEDEEEEEEEGEEEEEAEGAETGSGKRKRTEVDDDDDDNFVQPTKKFSTKDPKNKNHVYQERQSQKPAPSEEISTLTSLLFLLQHKKI